MTRKAMEIIFTQKIVSCKPEDWQGRPVKCQFSYKDEQAGVERACVVHGTQTRWCERFMGLED